MGLLSRWDRSNQKTMEAHGEIARHGVRITRGAKIAFVVIAAGCAVVFIVRVVAALLHS